MVASSTVPINMTMVAAFGSPEIVAVAAGSTATAHLKLPAIEPGI